MMKAAVIAGVCGVLILFTVLVTGARAPLQSSARRAWKEKAIAEILAYGNICRKEDSRIHDLFLGRGSDGRWYYSTFHFCKGMLVLKAEDQSEDLAAFAKAYYLELVPRSRNLGEGSGVMISFVCAREFINRLGHG